MKSLQHFSFMFFCILLCMIILLSFFLYLGRLCPKALVAREVGKPIVTNEVVRHNCLGINQIVSTSDKIYLMHANYGVISVYSNYGTYEYSISVYSHENGRVKLAYYDNLLHVQDKRGNVYRFQEDTFLDFIPENQVGDLMQHVDFNTESREYYLKGASIYREIGHGVSECVISRPPWLILTQARIAQPLLFVCMLACFVCLKLMKRKP